MDENVCQENIITYFYVAYHPLRHLNQEFSSINGNQHNKKQGVFPFKKVKTLLLELNILFTNIPSFVGKSI
jgi:hypothetical protein